MQSSIAALAMCLLISPTGLSQKKYYEFNNPDALKLTQKRIEMLTSVQWQGKDLKVSIRGDETTYKNGGWVIYNRDGTYSSNRLSSGTWEVKHNRYLVHTITEVREKKIATARNRLAGIYSITTLNDSTLTMTKLQSSSRDMLWSMSFSNKRNTLANRHAVAYYVQPFQGKPLSTREIDSISYLSREDLFINNFTVFDDTLYWNTADSFHKIKLNLKDPLRRVRIFQDNEVISFRVSPTRYTLPVDQLHMVDSLALSWIKAQDKFLSILIEHYFRQYVGYADAQGNKVILLNAFQTYRGSWKEDLVHDLTSTNDFRVFVNLTKQECFGLRIKD